MLIIIYNIYIIYYYNIIYIIICNLSTSERRSKRPYWYLLFVIFWGVFFLIMVDSFLLISWCGWQSIYWTSWQSSWYRWHCSWFRWHFTESVDTCSGEALKPWKAQRLSTFQCKLWHFLAQTMAVCVICQKSAVYSEYNWQKFCYVKNVRTFVAQKSKKWKNNK